MTRLISRRKVLASAAVGVAGLAGCSDDPDVSSVVEDDTESNENTDGDDPESQDDDVQDTSSNEESHERVDPEDTGLAVTQTAITSITAEDAWVILSATVTVQNEGRFEYELIEIRTDAYRTTPDAARQTAIGFAYSTEVFGSSSPFASGTEQFQVEIAIPRYEAPRQLETDWFDVTAVVRRADQA